MWGLIVASVSMIVVLLTSITLYMQQEKLKSDVNQKLNSVVDQINDSQLYEYNFDKQQEGNIKNVDQNVGTLYDSVIEAQKNVEFLKHTAVSKEELNKAFRSDQIHTNTLSLGQKFSLSGVGDGQGNDDWLRLADKTGSDYYGGLAAKHLWTRDNAWFNGNTNISGQLNVNGRATFAGAKSEFNPNKLGTYLPYVDGKNYIRGDTELLGNFEHRGIFNSEMMKIGHKFGDWTNNSVMSVYSPLGKYGASFGSEGGLWSHFPDRNQSTYIRPGREGASIYVGDIGASLVSIGKGDTSVEIKGNMDVKGKICIDNNCITAEDIKKIKMSGQSGFTGRYVKLYFDDNARKMLHVTEIEVYDMADNNVSASKPCTASSTNLGDTKLYGPQYLTDRSMTSLVNGTWRMACTNEEFNPWLMIDLQQDYPIKKIVIYNRDDCCQDKLVGVKLGILNANKDIIYSTSLTTSQKVYTLSF